MSAQFIMIPGGAIGCNVEQMTRLCTKMVGSIVDFESVFKSIDTAMSATAWSGSDADRFEAAVDRLRLGVMGELRSLTDAISTSIRNQAAQQQSSSA
jgi:hypothetical protein